LTVSNYASGDHVDDDDDGDYDESRYMSSELIRHRVSYCRKTFGSTRRNIYRSL